MDRAYSCGYGSVIGRIRAATLTTGENPVKITRNGIKPCSTCYRLRQFIRDGAGRVFPRPATHTEYTTRLGFIVVDRVSNQIVGVSDDYYRGMVGDIVEARKGYLFNKEHGTKIAAFTRTRKVVLTTSN